MPERISAEARSATMRAVKGAGTSSERQLQQMILELGHSAREQATDLPGRPDFAIDELRLAIFLDGDFWHGRDWLERGAAPERNRAYWITKFERNHARDRTSDAHLRSSGWSVLRIWESDLLADRAGVAGLLRARLVRRRQNQARRETDLAKRHIGFDERSPDTDDPRGGLSLAIPPSDVVLTRGARRSAVGHRGRRVG